MLTPSLNTNTHEEEGLRHVFNTTNSCIKATPTNLFTKKNISLLKNRVYYEWTQMKISRRFLQRNICKEIKSKLGGMIVSFGGPSLQAMTITPFVVVASHALFCILLFKILLFLSFASLNKKGKKKCPNIHSHTTCKKSLKPKERRQVLKNPPKSQKWSMSKTCWCVNAYSCAIWAGLRWSWTKENAKVGRMRMLVLILLLMLERCYASSL